MKELFFHNVEGTMNAFLRSTTIEKIAKNIYNKIQNASFSHIQFMKFCQKLLDPTLKISWIQGKKLSFLSSQGNNTHIVIYPNKKMLHLTQSQPGHYATLQRNLTK
jgi:hypothetical protein